MNTQKTLVVDLDDTLCIPNHTETDTFKKYGLAEPIDDMIQSLIKAKSIGFRIVIFTARRMLTHRGDINKVIEDVGEVTTNWLNQHNVPYDELQFGKPYGVYYIDDKAMLPQTFIDYISEA